MRRSLSLFVLIAGMSLGGRAAELSLAANLQQPNNLPVLVAQEQGYFAAEGLAVTVLHCAFGKLCLRMVTEGKAQFGTVGDLPIALAAQAGERFVILATINTNRNDTKIVTRRDAGIRRAADLADRRVGLYRGTTTQYAIESLMVFEGADPRRLRIVDLQPGEGRAKLLSREIDAAALFEPYAFEAAQALGSDALVIDTERIYTQTWNLVAQAGALDEAAAERLLRALDRAMAWIGRRPDAARALLQQRARLDKRFVDGQWPSLTYALTLDQALVTTLESQARWVQRSGLSRAAMPNFLTLIRSAPLRRVRPEGVGIVQ